MGKGYLDKLDKKTLNRHFPNKDHGGKGSHARISTQESRQKFLTGYDKIKWGNLEASSDNQDT
jgi:hypothetical protein